MLVDMAGSENIEQAGQNGFEAKMQVHVLIHSLEYTLILLSLGKIVKKRNNLCICRQQRSTKAI